MQREQQAININNSECTTYIRTDDCYSTWLTNKDYEVPGEYWPRDKTLWRPSLLWCTHTEAAFSKSCQTAGKNELETLHSLCHHSQPSQRENTQSVAEGYNFSRLKTRIRGPCSQFSKKTDLVQEVAQEYGVNTMKALSIKESDCYYYKLYYTWVEIFLACSRHLLVSIQHHSLHEMLLTTMHHLFIDTSSFLNFIMSSWTPTNFKKGFTSKILETHYWYFLYFFLC